MENPNNVPSTSPLPPTTPPVNPQSSQQQNDMVMSILAYLGILVLIPLFVAKNNPTVKFHTKQGLVLLVAWIISWIIWIVPVLGWIVGWLLNVGLLILAIIGIIDAINNQQKPLPLIGHLGEKFNF
jgi:uncharacterized membrane protein